MSNLPDRDPLVLVQRLAVSFLDRDIDFLNKVDAEIAELGDHFWRVIALCAASEYATEVVERRGEKAGDWLRSRIMFELDRDERAD